MQFVFAYDPSVAGAPAGFLTGLAAAANYLDSLITNPITVTVKVGWGENGGFPIPNTAVASGGPGNAYASLLYSNVRNRLAASATSAGDAVSVANLPSADPLSLSGALGVTYAQEKAWGLMPANGGEIDGSVGFSSSYTFSFDPANRAVPDRIDFIGVAEHELTHALGRYSGLFANSPSSLGMPLDLFRYASPGVNALLGAQPAYFSIDGGLTSLDPFDTSLDYGDWASSVVGDSFGSTRIGMVQQVTPADILALDVIGYTIAPLQPGVSNHFGTYAFTASDPVINLSGTGRVTLAGGGHTLNVLGGADTIFAGSASNPTTINTSYGAAVFYAADASGQTVDLLTGTGQATLVGAANNIMIDQNQGAGPGAIMVAAAGNETLFGAASGINDEYWGSFQGGNDLMVAGSGTDILVGGSGADTMVGGAGTDVFYVINARVIGGMINAPVKPGKDVIYNVHPGDILALTGFDSLYGAAGSGAAAKAVSAALAAGGGTVALSDGTTINFAGATAGLQIASS